MWSLVQGLQVLLGQNMAIWWLCPVLQSSQSGDIISFIFLCFFVFNNQAIPRLQTVLKIKKKNENEENHGKFDGMQSTLELGGFLYSEN